MNNPLVSIIIPARNAEATINKCIGSILDIKYPNYEVIVVDDGSSDRTKEILSAYPNIHILSSADKGPSEARNIALRQASGEFIAFTDADCFVDADWIPELLRGFTKQKVAGVGGTQKSPDDDTKFGKKIHEFLSIFGFISDYMKSGTKIRTVRHNPSCNVIYRKSVLIEMGGFLAGLWPGEDVELDYRIRRKGYLLNFNPGAVIWHYRLDNLKSFVNMMSRYGSAQGRLARKYGFFRVIHFMGIIFFVFPLLFLYNIYLGSVILVTFLIFLLIRLLLHTRNVFALLGLFCAAAIFWNFGFLRSLLYRNKL